MNPRSFLVRGLLAGLIAGLAAFFVSYTVGEPQVEAAIALEEAGAEAEAGHSHGAATDVAEEEVAEEEGTEVSRSVQKTWGLLTGTLAVSVVMGGVVALIVAGTAGRLGGLDLTKTTILVTALGYVSFALVPFLKYPASPPAVGDGDTIGHRTGVYFGFLLVSVIAVVAITYAAFKLLASNDSFLVVAAAIAAYVVVMVAAALVFPTVNELGDFPADILWWFRLATLFTITTMWSVIGLTLAWMLRSFQNASLPREAVQSAA